MDLYVEVCVYVYPDTFTSEVFRYGDVWCVLLGVADVADVADVFCYEGNTSKCSIVRGKRVCMYSGESHCRVVVSLAN